jgi:hypothetical protein
MSKKPQRMLGSLPVSHGKDAPARLAVFLWGPAGDGKTTFAATAPGVKLWLSMSDNEHVPVSGRDDVDVVDLSVLSLNDLFKHGQNDNPFGLDQLLAEDNSIETVVFDSATALAFRALQKAVEDGDGRGATFRPTIEVPGLTAYGGRNARTITVLSGILRVTAKHGVHCIITGHEDDPEYVKDQRGQATNVIDHIGIMLGGKLVNNMAWRLSEIWHLRQKATGDKGRILSFRPTAMRKPMKSRMFRYDSEPAFDLTYDAHKPDDAKGQMTIAQWHEAWMKGGKKKLMPPVSTKEESDAACA